MSSGNYCAMTRLLKRVSQPLLLVVLNAVTGASLLKILDLVNTQFKHLNTQLKMDLCLRKMTKNLLLIKSAETRRFELLKALTPYLVSSEAHSTGLCDVSLYRCEFSVCRDGYQFLRLVGSPYGIN